MKKMVALLVLLGIGFAAPIQAADQELSLWERLRKKIELLTPKKRLTTTTAAGGVRGTQADAEDVYWKGEAGTVTVDEGELAAFGKAIALVEEGNHAGARDAFVQFIKQHPDSPLKTDAETALAQLNATAK